MWHAKSLQKSGRPHVPPSWAPMFLGDDLLAWLVLALGGALLVGNVAAIVRPPGAAAGGRGPGAGARRRAAW